MNKWVDNNFRNLEEGIGNGSRNVSNDFSSLVTLVYDFTCVTLALEISVPDAGRSDREGRLS